MDQRIEAFLADVLALEGESPEAIREAVRAALADCEGIFAASAAFSLGDLTDSEWRILDPLLPDRGDRGPPISDKRPNGQWHSLLFVGRAF